MSSARDGGLKVSLSGPRVLPHDSHDGSPRPQSRPKLSVVSDSRAARVNDGCERLPSITARFGGIVRAALLYGVGKFILGVSSKDTNALLLGNLVFSPLTSWNGDEQHEVILIFQTFQNAE